MIVGTKTVEMKVKEAFGKENVNILPIRDVINRLKLDPGVSSPSIDAYVVSMMDLKTTGIKQDFKDAAASKHPNSKVVLVARGKSDIPEGNGIDKVLINAKAGELAAIVAGLTTQSGPIMEEVEETRIPEFVPVEEEYTKPAEEVQSKAEPERSEPEKVEELHIEEPVIQEQKAETPVFEGSGLIERVNSCQKLVDLEVLTQELKASALVKDIIRDNRQYAAIEERLQALQERINAIFMDASIPNMEEKMEKINAILVEQNNYGTRSNTIIGQRVIDIITAVAAKMSECVKQRIKELDTAIKNTYTANPKVEYVRLSAVADERANILNEIAELNEQLEKVCDMSDSFAHSIVDSMTEKSSVGSENPLIEAHLRLRHKAVISEGSFNVMKHILEASDKASSEYAQALQNLEAMYRQLVKLIDLDNESITALKDIVALLRTNKVTSMITADTPLKESMSVFVGDEGTGHTVIPYIVSKRRSRENANVLLIDFTGSAKYQNYGVDKISIDELYDGIPVKDLLIVDGTKAAFLEDINKILDILNTAAKQYRVINVVIRPAQLGIASAIVREAGVVNYIVVPSRDSLTAYKKVIAESKYENVAQRIVINKCDIEVRPVLEQLDVIDRGDIQYVKVGVLPAITECGLLGIDPTSVNSVIELTREVWTTC